MRVKSKFVDADGERELDECVAANDEGAKMIEEVYVQSFRDMLTDALKEGDDVEILVKRVPTNAGRYVG